MPPRRQLSDQEKEIKRNDLIKGRKVVESNRLKKKELEILKAQYPSSSDTDSDSDEDKDEVIQINPDESDVKRFSKDIKLVKRSEVEFLRQELENVKRIVASKRAPNGKKSKAKEKEKEKVEPPQEKVEPTSPKVPSPVKVTQTLRQNLDETRLSNILIKKSASSSSLSKEHRVNNLLMRMRLK